jgi:hypothetical protein
VVARERLLGVAVVAAGAVERSAMRLSIKDADHIGAVMPVGRSTPLSATPICCHHETIANQRGSSGEATCAAVKVTCA